VSRPGISGYPVNLVVAGRRCVVVGAGRMGLPIIGRLLGHTQASTTARYAHLDNDPLRRASEAIAGRIAAALDGNRRGSVVALRRRANR